MREFFKEFSFPGGIGSHCTPETPGSIHEGGELGYSISHAFGAAFDNPDLLVAVVATDHRQDFTGPRILAHQGRVVKVVVVAFLGDLIADNLLRHVLEVEVERGIDPAAAPVAPARSGAPLDLFQFLRPELRGSQGA